MPDDPYYPALIGAVDMLSRSGGYPTVKMAGTFRGARLLLGAVPPAPQLMVTDLQTHVSEDGSGPSWPGDDPDEPSGASVSCSDSWSLTHSGSGTLTYRSTVRRRWRFRTYAEGSVGDGEWLPGRYHFFHYAFVWRRVKASWIGEEMTSYEEDDSAPLHIWMYPGAANEYSATRIAVAAPVLAWLEVPFTAAAAPPAPASGETNQNHVTVTLKQIYPKPDVVEDVERLYLPGRIPGGYDPRARYMRPRGPLGGMPRSVF